MSLPTAKNMAAHRRAGLGAENENYFTGQAIMNPGGKAPGLFYRLYVLLPVFNDWEACCLLVQKIQAHCSIRPDLLVKFIIVNDGSADSSASCMFPCGDDIEIIHLTRNLGHQKAIAVGLSYIARHKKCDGIVVMDSDGEDDPAHITRLLDAATASPGKIIFASRSKRHEGVVFKLFYMVYKQVFSLLTGQSISFGNFCIIPIAAAKKVIYVSEIWNHFSGGVIRSKLPYSLAPCERGTRMAGQSNMNFVSLVLHGFNAISVHIDTVAVRLLIGTITLMLLAGAGVISVVVLKFFTDLAIPGWATSAATGFAIILMQAFFISLFLIFIVLNYRMQRLIVPAVDYKDFILTVEKTGKDANAPHMHTPFPHVTG